MVMVLMSFNRFDQPRRAFRIILIDLCDFYWTSIKTKGDAEVKVQKASVDIFGALRNTFD